MIINHKRDYREARRSEYPSIGDQLDAVYKLAKSLQSTIELPASTVEWMNQIEAIKTKYKKD